MLSFLIQNLIIEKKNLRKYRGENNFVKMQLFPKWNLESCLF